MVSAEGGNCVLALVPWADCLCGSRSYSLCNIYTLCYYCIYFKTAKSTLFAFNLSRFHSTATLVDALRWDHGMLARKQDRRVYIQL